MEQQQQRTHLHHWNSCRLDRCGPVYILTLTGEGDHRFNPSSLDDILAALTVVEQSPNAGALVTTNEGRYFSNGLDLKWVQNSGSLSSLGVLRNKFEGLLSFMMKLGIPTIAAVCGHAAAGGFMLALAHDYRFMKNGRAVLYMSELDHGMNMPRSLMSVIRSKLLPASLREVVLKARKFTASEAFEYGCVDGFYDDSAKTIEAAIAEAEKLASSNWKRESYANLRAGAFPGVIRSWKHKEFLMFGQKVQSCKGSPFFIRPRKLIFNAAASAAFLFNLRRLKSPKGVEKKKNVQRFEGVLVLLLF